MPKRGTVIYNEVKMLFLLIPAFAISAQQDMGIIKLSANDAVEMALKNNYTLKAIDHQLNQTEYGIKSARTNFLPKVSISGNYARLGIDMDESASGNPMFSNLIKSMFSDNSFSAAITIQQPVFNGFSTIYALQSAKIAQAIQEKNNIKTREKMHYAVLQVYLGLINLEKSQSVSIEAVRQLEEITANQKARLGQGMVTEYDYLQVEASLEQAKVNELNVRKTILSTRRQFSILLGLPPSSNFVLTDTIMKNGDAVMNLDSILQYELLSRPDISQAKLNIELALLGVKSVKSSLYPSINAGFKYSFDRPDKTYQDNWGDSWTGYLSLNFNLLDWGNRNFQIRKAQEQELSLEELLKEKKLQVEKEIIDAYYNVGQSKESLKAVELLVNAKEKAYYAANAKYEQGVLSMSDLLDSYTSLTTAKYQVLQAKMNLELAIINLEMGGLGQSSLQ